jgi:hypothetical protein
MGDDAECGKTEYFVLVSDEMRRERSPLTHGLDTHRKLVRQSVSAEYYESISGHRSAHSSYTHT